MGDDGDGIKEIWQGTASCKLTGCGRDRVWPLLEDFFNIQKWVPTVDTCEGIQGTSGQPGCVRYCAKTGRPAPRDPGDREVEIIGWAKEKLLETDPVGKWLRYEILENNVGFESYVVRVELVPWETSGCEIVWSFTGKPVRGWTLRGLVSFYGSALETMGKRMEQALLSV